MEDFDDELRRFEAEGAPAILPADDEGFVEHDGARIWYATHGAGKPVILLHGGLGHSGNWGNQVPALVRGGYRAVLIDSRGHGRSTRDGRAYTYELMGSDVIAVMDQLGIGKAILVGWSDGACTSLILADREPDRVAGVFFFACNMDPSGLKPFVATVALDRCFARHTKDYAELSATPGEFKTLVADVSRMGGTQPNYSADDLGRIGVPVSIVQSEKDEFIRLEHAEHLARSIPGAELVVLGGVSHFAPLQRPEEFNRVMMGFVEGIQ